MGTQPSAANRLRVLIAISPALRAISSTLRSSTPFVDALYARLDGWKYAVLRSDGSAGDFDGRTQRGPPICAVARIAGSNERCHDR
jgi:hypothetical protein